jgi:hypothetical protein
MANIKPTSETVSVERVDQVAAATREERTRRVVIETPKNGAYSILVYREVVVRDADGNVLAAREIPAPIHRVVSSIIDQKVTIGGIQVPAARIIAALPMFFDMWADEDIAAGRRG